MLRHKSASERYLFSNSGSGDSNYFSWRICGSMYERFGYHYSALEIGVHNSLHFIGNGFDLDAT